MVGWQPVKLGFQRNAHALGLVESSLKDIETSGSGNQLQTSPEAKTAPTLNPASLGSPDVNMSFESSVSVVSSTEVLVRRVPKVLQLLHLQSRHGCCMSVLSTEVCMPYCQGGCRCVLMM